MRLGVEATADAVQSDAPAIVVVAAGAAPLPDPVLDGADRRVFDVTALDDVPAGHVLVADEVGRADAMLLAEALGDAVAA